MSSGGIYNIASSALIANQLALDLTSQNIANVNTPGYSRQLPLFEERNLNIFASGVDVTGKQRLYDTFLEVDVRNNASLLNHTQSYYNFAVQVDDLLTNSTANLNSQFSDFFSSIQKANSDPANILNREVLLSQTQILTNRFHDLGTEVESKYTDNEIILNTTTEQINGYLDAIQNINLQVKNKSEGVTSLLDKRKAIMEDLSELIGFSAIEQADNTVGLFVGTGDSLISGSNVMHVVTLRNPADLTRIEIGIEKAAGPIQMTKFITGGQLGGLLAYRNEILDTARNELGRIALTFSDQMNQQNQLGMDLNGNLGQLVYRDINDASMIAAREIANQNNTGNGNIEVSITDLSALTSSDYTFRVAAGNMYTLVKEQDGTLVSSGSIGGLPSSINVDGLNITLQSGTFNDGDSYLLIPTREGARNLTLTLNDSAQFALASPVRAEADNANLGNGKIKGGLAVDTTNASFTTPGTLSPPIDIVFLSPTSYQLVDANTLAVIEGPIAYDPNIDNPIFPTPGSYDPGYRFDLTGKVNASDTFHLVYNTDGISDNRNGLQLDAIQNKEILKGNNSSIKQAYNQMTANIANKTYFAYVNQQANDMLHQQSLDRRDALSGVNLDEEAINLLKYQQAYQASAQLVHIANQMFESLLGIMGV